MVQYFDHDKYTNTDTRVVYLNSKSRQSGVGEIYNATYHLPDYLMAVSQDTHIEIQLQSFVCKYSFYNIDTGRNADMELSTNGVAWTAKQLPVGNYSTKEIASNIQTIFRSITGDNIEVEWNKNLNKLKVIQDSFNINNLYVKIPKNETGYEIFGVPITDTTLNGDGTRQFQVGSVVNTPAGFTGTYFPAVMSIGNEESLFLHADFGSNRNINVEAEENVLEKSTFAKIHIIAPFFGNIYYSASSYTAYTTRFPDGVAPETTIRIWLTDELGNYMKLQNDYQLVLRILRHRKRLNKQNETLEKLLSLQAIDLIDKKRGKK